MRGDGIINSLLASGLYTTSKNPWTSGKLAAWAKQYGFKVKQDVVIKKTPPWAKSRGYLDAMSPAQLEAIKALSELAHRLAGTGKVIPAEVKFRLDNKTYGGKSDAERREEKRRQAEYTIAKINELLAKKGRPVRAVAPAPIEALAPPFD